MTRLPMENSGRLRNLLTKLVLPAEEWAEYSESKRLRPAPALVLGALFSVLGLSVASLLAVRQLPDSGFWTGLFLLLSLTAILFLVAAMHRIETRLLQPMRRLHAWAVTMCDGNLGTHIEVSDGGDFGKLAYHINRLSSALDQLANEMDDLVTSQTETLRLKNSTLETLYDFSATLHSAKDLDELLDTSVKKMMELVSAGGAAIRLRARDGEMRLVRSIGSPDGGSNPSLLENGFSELEAATSQVSSFRNGSHPALPHGLGLVSIPLRYRDRMLGVYSLFTEHPEFAEGGEVRQLLGNLGEDLGMALEKFRLDETERNLSLVKERSALAHELHDSLAQTLVSLRFQIRMLAETLENNGNSNANREVLRMTESIELANNELRELLANFRAPVDERGLLTAIADLVSQFQSKSGIAAYFQSDCTRMRFPLVTEMQVLRIVGEALANVRKHSRAKTVRVLVSRGEDPSYRVLIEDDGIGISPGWENNAPGENIGLSIMRERAARIGGALNIDSEPGEGARIELTFSEIPLPETAQAQVA